MYIQRYADILKTYLHNDILEKMICEENMKYEYHKNDSNNLYFNIKNIIEDYSLFQYLKLDFNAHSTLNNGLNIITKLSNDEINKGKILIFKISAFYGNKDILPIRISLERNSNELKKYSRDTEKIVRQAVAKNPNTPQKTLVLLSKDIEEEVRQAAINTINLLKSQNDENK